MASSSLDVHYERIHFAWYDTEAKPATDRVGQHCREGARSVFANEFADKLRMCIAGCDGGDAPSCVVAALWLLNATGNEAADRPRALEFLERACLSREDPLACFILGEELDRGANVAKHDPEGARAAWGTGCEQHEDNSCAALRGERVEIETHEIYRAPGH